MNDLSKASLQRSWYEVIRRKKDPVKRARLYDMAFGYLYEGIVPDEDDEFFDLFLSWKPQMDYELACRISGKKGQRQRMETLDRSFSDTNVYPKLGFPEPQFANVNDNVNVNDNDNAHANDNVNVEEPAGGAGEACGGGVCAIDVPDTHRQEKQDKRETPAEDWGVFQLRAFEAIRAHNSKAGYTRRLFISPDLLQFSQRECRDIVSSLRERGPAEILRALRNYLAVAELADTWKKGFSVQNFIREYPKWADKDFSLELYTSRAAPAGKERDPPKEPSKPVHVWRRCSVCGAVYPYAHVLCERCMEHDGAEIEQGESMYASPYARRLEVMSGERMPAEIEEAENDGG